MTARRWGWRAAAVVASGACFHASIGLLAWCPLAWIAPLPLLALRDGPGRAWVHGFLAYGLGLTSVWRPLASIVPTDVLVVGSAFVAAYFGTVMAVTAWIAARTSGWARVLAYPVALTAFDAFAYRISPDLGSYSLAYTQASLLPLVQIAAVLGPSAVVFVMALLPAALAERFTRERSRGSALVGWAIAVEALVLGLGYGRTVAHHAGDATVRVGVAASDPDLRFYRTERRDEAIAVVESYARRVRMLAERGATLIVLPEKMVSVAPAYRDEAQAVLADAARAARARVVAGINLTATPTRRNVAWVFGPDGRLELEYDKRLLVPGYEDGYAAGREAGFVRDAAGLLGVAVCRDLFLPQPFHAYGRAGARILLVPAWDFTTDAALETRAPVLRAVEGGYPVVRAAQEGILLVVDATGRVLLHRPSWEEREVMAVVDVPLGSGGTIYAHLGDTVDIAAWVALLSMIGLALRRRARTAA